MPSFSCQAPGGADLCFNGGMCSNSSTVTRCACPEGWGPDTSFFHFANCTLPSNFYLGFLAFSTVTSLPLLALIGRQIPHTRSNTRLVAMFLFNTILFAWLYHFGLYYENGCYAYALVPLLISLGFEGATMSLLTLGLIDPVFGLGRRIKFLQPLKELLWGRRFFSAFLVLFTPFFIALPLLSRQDVQRYNNAVAVFFLTVPTVGLAYMLAVKYLSGRLLRELVGLISEMDTLAAGTLAKADIDDLRRRVARLNAGATSTTIMILACYPIPTVYLAIGSLPYAWIVSPLGAYSGCLVFAASVLRFLSSERRRRVHSEQDPALLLGDNAENITTTKGPTSPAGQSISLNG